MKNIVVLIMAVTACLTISMGTALARSADTIRFDYKSSEINAAARTQLDQMSLDLKHLRQILITSYVPSVGDVALNQQFANERVEAVKSYLIQQGVPADVVSTQTIPGSQQRLVELSYGSAPAGASQAPSTYVPTSPPPAAPPAPLPAAAPPPPQEPVITAQPSKTYESGITEADISDQPYRGQTNTPPSRWEY